VKLVDGTGILMPDTAANQACYLQPSSQTPGVGSPLARLVGVICLSTGALIDAAMDRMRAKTRANWGCCAGWYRPFRPAMLCWRMHFTAIIFPSPICKRREWMYCLPSMARGSPTFAAARSSERVTIG
jgi:hypothetical protein